MEDSVQSEKVKQFPGLNKWIKIFFLFCLPVLLLITAFSFYLYSKYPNTSPFNSTGYLISAYAHPHLKMEKEVIGFIPYWRMDDIKYIRFDLISEIIYFSLSVNENGQFVKVISGETDPGWRWWKGPTVNKLITRTQVSGGKFSVSIAMHKNETLEKFLDNPDSQTTLITNLLQEVQSRHLNGINIDFEYNGSPPEGYREKFTMFSQTLANTFEKESPETELSIDTFPLSIRKPRLFDIPKLGQFYDKIVVMSYDFYGVSSDIAGPTAPMGGFVEERYLFDITTAYQDYSQAIPKEKIIMGVPYYGWDWPVENGKTAQSPTLKGSDRNGYPSVISYGRAKDFNKLQNDQCSFEPLAQTKWCWYTDLETNADHQVWLEDNQSIEAKFSFAKNQDLGGVAIWVLGYDKDYPDLWKMITKKFTKR
ncbi:MAG: hypothetical protein C4584_01020 [Armatimonadetes bacterium]|nr:MAG: hypothetical protein C4584_01020 [Armatimonadota bacterium]